MVKSPKSTIRILVREVAEWSKAHAWNACVAQATEGSNPFLSAISDSSIQSVEAG